MRDPLSIGVLGGAEIAVRFMLPALAAHPRFRLAAVASRDPDKARALADRFACRPLDYAGLVESPDVEALYIPLPVGLHAEWAARAIEAGKHVLCEKSLTPTRAESVALCELAQRRNRLLMETFQFRFHSQQRQIKSWLAAGRIGELRAFRASFGFPPFKDPANIRYSRALGGGALLDAGCYTLKAVSFFLGGGFRVQSASRWRPAGAEVDLAGAAQLARDRDGVAAQLAFGFDHFYQCSCEFWGSRGRLLAKRVFTAPPGFAPEVTLETADGAETAALPPDDHFAGMLDHFADGVETGRFDDERRECLEQARLLDQVLERAHAR